jgi:hypothetical protein
MDNMIFEDKLKEELIKTEVQLIELSFTISDKLGETAVTTAIDNFYSYLCRGLGEERIIASMNMEYRKFVIDLLKVIPSELLPKCVGGGFGGEVGLYPYLIFPLPWILNCPFFNHYNIIFIVKIIINLFMVFFTNTRTF